MTIADVLAISAICWRPNHGEKVLAKRFPAFFCRILAGNYPDVPQGRVCRLPALQFVQHIMLFTANLSFVLFLRRIVPLLAYRSEVR